MKKIIKGFFIKYEGYAEVKLSEIKDFFYEYTDFEVTNPNQWYLFKQQIGYFLSYKVPKIYYIDWKRVEKIFKERKWKHD